MVDKKFDYDQESSVMRSTRSIVTMLDAALESLRAKGVDAKRLNIKHDDDGHHVTVDDKIRYTVKLIGREDGRSIDIVGTWIA